MRERVLLLSWACPVVCNACILLNERYGSNESKECECEERGENEIVYKSLLLLRRMDGIGQKRRRGGGRGGGGGRKQNGGNADCVVVVVIVIEIEIGKGRKQWKQRPNTELSSGVLRTVFLPLLSTFSVHNRSFFMQRLKGSNESTMCAERKESHGCTKKKEKKKRTERAKETILSIYPMNSKGDDRMERTRK